MKPKIVVESPVGRIEISWPELQVTGGSAYESRTIQTVVKRMREVISPALGDPQLLLADMLEEVGLRVVEVVPMPVSADEEFTVY